MSDDASSPKHEIVIVRRRGGDDAAAGKGGAWKIAYADFVTAMMAFFLVMWLINASNEKTRAQVASYFNPIKLTDAATGNRGLKDRKNTKTTSGNGDTEETAGGTPPVPSDVRHEAAIMADPDKALAEVEDKLDGAGKKDHGVALIVEEGDSATPENAAPGVGDPFDPRSWDKASQAPYVPKPEPAGAPKAVDRPELQPAVVPPAAGAAASTAEAAPSPEAAAAPKAADTDAGDFAAEAAAVSAEIAARMGSGLEELPASIEVRSTDEGLLISLTDKQSFGMFNNGSAEPEPELLRLVEAIAASLANRPGYVVVRGHTDARPYRNKNYDNWQLSTARAHMAQYMLVRGGLDQQRIRRVEGLADREPRNSEDPQAPENRRIEILLGRKTP